MSSSSSSSAGPPLPPQQPPPCSTPPPCDTCPQDCPAETDHPIRYWNGAITLVETDVAVPQGDLFSHQRLYGNQTVGDYDGPNGWNWFVPGLPYIAPSGTSVALVFDPNNPYWFDQPVAHTYAPRFALDWLVALKENQTAKTLTWGLRGRPTGARAPYWHPHRLQVRPIGTTTTSDTGVAKVAKPTRTVKFNSQSAASNPLSMLSHTDERGVTSTVTSRTGMRINQVQRTFTVNSTLTTEQIGYTYFSTGSAAGKLQYVTFSRQVGAGAMTAVSRAAFAYYGTSEDHGSQNDLKTATRQVPDGSGGWNDVGVCYYRYWTATDMGAGFVHGLKYQFGPEAYRLMFNDLHGVAGIEGAADTVVAAYADHYFEYDGNRRVTLEISAVCPSCPGGGTTTDTFAYNPGTTSTDYNVWAMQCVQTLPDQPNNSQIIVYTNFAGMPMLKVYVEGSTGNKWCTFWRYDANGQVILMAMPSAVNGYDDTHGDLLVYNSGTGKYQYLNDNAGLVYVTDYYPSTAATPTVAGGVAGYVQDVIVKNGQVGDPLTTSTLVSFTYFSSTDSNGNTIYPVAAETIYPNIADTTTTIVTSYAYSFYSNNVMQQRTTNLPSVPTTQNGDGSTPTVVENFDAYGNLTSRVTQQASGISVTDNFKYDDAILGAVDEQVLNYQSGVTQPGVNVTTDFTYDSSGRLTQSLGPSHQVVIGGVATTVRPATWNVYVQTADPGGTTNTWDVDQLWTGRGYATGTGPSYTYTLVDPVSILKLDKDGRTTDQITSKRSTGSGALSPTDTYVQTDWQTWTSTQYNSQHQTTSSRLYFLIPSSGTGTSPTNYAETDFGYDQLERRNYVKTPGGTITRTVWTAPQRVASVWVGTNDAGATDTNPAGTGAPNNMVKVSSNVYDALVAELSAPSAPTLSDVPGGTLAATTYYVTVSYTNSAGETLASAESSWPVAANRLLKVTSPAAASGMTGYNVYVGTTTGRETRQNGATPIAIGTDWPEPAGGLVSGVHMPIGGDGNLTQQVQYASPTDTRTTNYGYDYRDRRISMSGEVSSYEAYTLDNLDRMTQVDSRNTNGSGNLIGRQTISYDNRGRVFRRAIVAVDPSTGATGNSLFENNWYDYVGNMIQRVGPGDGTAFTKSTYNGVGWATGWYWGYNTSGLSWSQAATVSGDIIVQQVQNTYDEMGNGITVTSFERLNDATGTGALSGGTQPKARVSYSAVWFDGLDRQIASGNYGATTGFSRLSTPPPSTATLLVDHISYNDAGLVGTVTDPMGRVTQTSYDNAIRVTQTVEAWGSGIDRTMQYAYTPDGLTSTLAAVNGTTGNQVTTYTYGTTLTESGVARNDLLRYIDYPDSVSGSDRVAYTYNTQSQQTTLTDQRGTIRTFYYDKRGRLTDDSVSHVGSNTDSAVLRVSTAYEVRGLTQTVTSYDNATPSLGTVLNQVQLTYNSFGQLTKEQQEHSGAVSGSSLNVQYGYDAATSTSNEIRPASLTYPNSRVITYSHGTSGGVDDYLNRVTSIVDGTTTLASYTYLGLGNVIRIDNPQPQVRLDLWGGTSGMFNGFDLFGRITDQRWLNYSTSTDLDRYQYGYDQNSNRQWKANLLTTGLDEYYTYDALNRLTQMQRGTLNGTKTGISGTAARELDYTLDPTGNWSAYLTKTNGTTDLNQARTSNKVNEITGVTSTPTWATPAYDAAGNMITMPQLGTPASSYTAVYDAWNRMVSLSAGGSTVATYKYDGRNRRIVKFTAATSETRHFYYTDHWQDIEERTGSPAVMERQYVWGIRYVDELVCRDRTAERIFGVQDGGFSVTSICNVSGSIVERYGFDPYGIRTIRNSTWSPIASSAYTWVLGYQCLPTDIETGLITARSRTLHPLLGAWVQRDSEHDAGESLYEVLRSKPTRYNDPFGNKVVPPPQEAEGVEVAKYVADLYAKYKSAAAAKDCAAAFKAIRTFRDAMIDVGIPEEIARRWSIRAEAENNACARKCEAEAKAKDEEAKKKKKKEKYRCTTKPRGNCPSQCKEPYEGYGKTEREAKDAAESACAADGCNTPGGDPYNCQCAHTTCTERPN